MYTKSGKTQPTQIWKIRQYICDSVFYTITFLYFRVPNHYICPVFKWGSTDEWQFGLERVIQFPKTRIQSERTYLLKMLAGCSTQSEKIYRLLELSIFEEHSNFTENDQFLIFSSLTGSSSGYYTLFNFLSDYWTPIRQK